MPRNGFVSRNGGGLRPIALALLLAAGAAGAAKAGQIELISKADPIPGSTGTGFASALSADGRWVVFESDSPNLIPGQVDASGTLDVFLRDRVTGTTTLISHQAGKPATASPQAGECCSSATLSADGRYVAYSSLGTRLAPDQADSNHAADVFLYDRVTGATTLISHALGDPSTTADGISSGAAISADGSSVVFWSEAGNLVSGQTSTSSDPGRRTSHLFLYDRSTGSITLLSHAAGSPAATANNSSFTAAISADGGYVAFASDATNLLPGVITAPLTNVFLWERATGRLSLVSHASGAATTAGSSDSLAPQISADGRWIAFNSRARNLVAGQTASPGAFRDNVYLFDRASGRTRLVSHASASPLIAAGVEDPYSNGGCSLSADGRWVAFTSSAPDLVAGQVNLASGPNVFLYDRAADRNVLVSHKQGSQTTSPARPFSLLPQVSADGGYVAYVSFSSDLVPHQVETPESSDVFLYDRAARTSVLVSHVRSSLTKEARSSSELGQISADGGTVVFDSYATDLAGGQVDFQAFVDAFLFDRKSAEVTQLDAPAPELPDVTPFGASSAVGISADGRYVVFASLATGLVPGQVDMSEIIDPFGNRDNNWDVFLRDRATGKTTLLSRSKASPRTAAGGLWSALSADGGFVALVLDGISGTPASLWLYDRAADRLTLVNHAPGSLSTPSGVTKSPPVISADGRWVAYDCVRCELVAGQQSPFSGGAQAYLYDRLTGANTLASHAAGSPTARGDKRSRTVALSAGGRYVLFESVAANLAAGQSRSGAGNLFVFDRRTGAVELVSHTAASATTPSDAATSDEAISADGRWIAFSSAAPDLVPGAADGNGRNDVFLYDQTTGAVTLVSHAAGSPTAAAGESRSGALSADGRWLVFTSTAADLLPGLAGGVANVFLYDRDTGTISLVSSAPGAPGTPVTGGADSPSLSADGSRIAFLSPAGPHQPGQPGLPDSAVLYVQERATGARVAVGRALAVSLYGYGDHDSSFLPLLSANGLQVAFTSKAPLVFGDLNFDWDAFVYDGSVP